MEREPSVNTAFEARDALVAALRRELVGPDPHGTELDCSQRVVFPEPDRLPTTRSDGGLSDTPEAYRPYRQAGSGDEILSHRDKPARRYGVGVLYPVQSNLETGEPTADTPAAALEAIEEQLESGNRTEASTEPVEEIANRIGNTRHAQDSDDFDVSLANSFQPSSLGLSFLVDLSPGAKLVVRASGGRYVPLPVTIGSQELTWQRRIGCEFRSEFTADLLPPTVSRVRWPDSNASSENAGELNIRVEAYVRPNPVDGQGHLVTVILVNREAAGGHSIDNQCLFQCELRIDVEGPGTILPYPTRHREETPDPEMEDLGLELLYSQRLTYAVGHGCAANWGRDEGASGIHIFADVLPQFETPSITAEMPNGEGGIRIASLVDLSGGDGLDSLRRLVTSYECWIAETRQKIPGLEKRFQKAANRHLRGCDEALARMNAGLQLLQSDPKVLRAFELANSAILLQQAAGVLPSRSAKSDSSGRRIVFSPSYSAPNPADLEKHNRGRWFPFQAAFILSALCSLADDGDDFRECVDLIWFPTGGGKTEAYLGVAAFYLFLRRLRLPADSGTSVLMRYTLRLLTTDQFQRAARLMTAMETIRRHTSALGEERFTIGLWVGGDTTPNRRAGAKSAYSELKNRRRAAAARNPFVVDSCPWCGAEMGPVKGRLPRNVSNVLGYKLDAEVGTIVFHCPDSSCDFFRGLPVSVIDEDLYATPPSILIGTVDKFAQLAWRSDTRNIFGIGGNGERLRNPPGLIIQDELHLISGPLGSMVGLYETTIEDLCTVEGKKPKIICSTATIRRYAEQVQSLYGRTRSTVFPPPGIDADDSFFARHAIDKDGRLLPGRLYVGVHAPGLQSMQTAQVRTISALLQAPMSMSDDLRDPWWTPLVFFNSLRELGTTLSLVQSDIPDYLDAIRRRGAIPWSELRSLEYPIELTGRISSEDVPAALAALRHRYATSRSNAVDICLASNMVEVGVDIARLSLMVVVGQPKSTAAYIQATGRIGRDWKEKPGLVVTIYGASKPRDRSHFEKFRTYHERLYAQVEPLSVTPMSEPALERALHAVALSFVRQRADADTGRSPRPFSDWRPLLDEFEDRLMARAAIVAPTQIEVIRQILAARRNEWERWNRAEWGSPFNRSQEIPLMVSAGSHIPPVLQALVWQTPTSLRNVDQECEMQVPVEDMTTRESEDV